MTKQLLLVTSCAFLLITATAASGQTPNAAAIYKERCASCHDPGPGAEATRAPAREVLRSRTPQQIFGDARAWRHHGRECRRVVDGGETSRRRISRRRSDHRIRSRNGSVCSRRDASRSCIAPSWNGWGNDTSNSRFQNAKAAGLTAADVPKLTLKWAFGFPGATTASGQPTVAAGRVFVGNVNGMVYSLDAKTGCTHWAFKADDGVRTAISVVRLAINGAPRTIAMFGDIRANAYAIDAQSGTQIWKTKVDDHAMARITGAPSYHNGRLYVPVASIEEVAGARPNYQCCTFRGSVVALDAVTGKQLWKTYTMEAPKMVGQNSAGTPQWKPAGAAIWTSPTIDAAKNAIYVATGNAYTTPAAPTSDAVIALDMTTGAIRWVQQVTPNDTFVIGCKPGVAPCADEVGPDFDFGNSPILRTLPGGRRVLSLGQKSGVVWGLAPDENGKVLWQVPRRQGQHARWDRVGIGRRRSEHLCSGLRCARAF